MSNLDLYRRARQLGFGRLVLADTIPNFIVTLAAWPLAVYFRDYRAVVCLLLARAILSSTLSQMLAERAFHPRLERTWIRESLAFGWPLLLSGLIQFGNFQGDSMVVAAGYPLAKLGEFSVALTMAMTPAFALMRVCQSLILPVLSQVQDDLSHLTRRYQKYVDLTALLACAATLGMLFCGEPVVVMFFGAKYAGVGILASWLIAAQGLRIVRGATVAAAMARGDTMNMMVCSAWRLCGLPLAIGVGLVHGSLTSFAVTGFIAEIVALAAAVSRLFAHQGIPRRVTVAPAGLAFGCVLGAAVGKWVLGIPAYSLMNWGLFGLSLCLSVGAFAVFCPELRSIALNPGFKFFPRMPWQALKES